MPSAADAPEEVDEAATEEVDEARQALLEAVNAELGDAVVGQHLIPGRDVWVRVSTEAWGDTADYLRNRQRFRFFDYLSAIDWMPSPYGRSLDAAVDADESESSDDADAPTAESAIKVAGGDTRFQVIARVYSLATGIGLHIKADVGDELAVGTWIDTYPGANWHEREVHEMFGISFTGNPDMRNLYLPGDFEGYPLRKDYPLMARLIKPWPGIVDVEPMPELDEPEDAAAASAPSTTNPEDAS
ncbi:MAG: NADH-quinone oxidoreductase subunit C [Actinomycetota bacterium]